MNLVFGSKKKGKFIVKLILLAAFLYATALFVSQRVLINNKQKKINEMKEKISVQEVKIGEIKSELDAINSSDGEYLEKIAHQEYKLSRKGERVFVNAKGN